MKKFLLKTTTLLLLLLVLTFSIGLIIYPHYSNIKIRAQQLNTRQITNNTALNIFSRISYTKKPEKKDTEIKEAPYQIYGKTIEYVSKKEIEKHKKEHGEINLEKLKSKLEIKSANIYGYIVDGDDANAMDRGFWHYPISAPPGNQGNTVIIGHRFLKIPPDTDTLYNLDEIRIGDRITIYQSDNIHTYTIINKFVVDKNNTSVLENTDDYRITIITCTPLWSSEERLIVIGKMDRIYGNI